MKSHTKSVIFLCIIAISGLSMCKKPGEAVADTYKGTLVIDGYYSDETLSDVEVIIEENFGDPRSITVSCEHFESFELNLTKKRFFGSKAYTTRGFELTNDGKILFEHSEGNSQTDFVFSGERQ